MDNLDPASKPAPEELKEVREHKKSKLLGSMISQPGLITYEYNKLTKELKEAEFVTTILESATGKGGFHPEKQSFKNTLHKIVVNKDNCLYFQALNWKNAMRKIDRLQKGL